MQVALKDYISNYFWSILGKPDSKEVTVEGYDAVLLTSIREQYEQGIGVKLITDARIIQVGYTRALKEWEQSIDKNTKKYLKGEISTPYLFFPLDVVGTWILGEKCASGEVKLEECLKVLKDYNDDVLTVFRPHHKTDVKKVRRILDSIGYENYVISYLHPLILIKNAKFTLTYSPSSLLVEAHMNGCTTVEYADYDVRYNRHSYEKPIHFGCVDYFICRDKEHLRQVVDKLVYNGNNVKKKPKEFEEGIPILSSKEIKCRFSWL